MADLVSSAVTVLDAWPEGGLNNKRFTVKKLSLVLATQGSGATNNKIPAAALGMTTVDDVTSFVKSDNTVIIPASPNAANNEILLGGGAANVTASYSGTFIATIRGQTAPAV